MNAKVIELILKAFEVFKKNKISAILFASLIGIGFWVNDLRKDAEDNKDVQAQQNKDCNEKVRQLENWKTLDEHEDKKTDSTLSAVLAQWKLMEKLGILKIPD